MILPAKFHSKVGKSYPAPPEVYARTYSVPKVDSGFRTSVADETSVEGVFIPGALEDHPSWVVQKKSVGLRTGEVFDEMFRTDSTLFGLWEKRYKAVLGLPRLIVAASDKKKDKRVAEFCHQALSCVKNFQANLIHQMGSITHGIAFDEIIWSQHEEGPLKGFWVPDQIIDRPMWRFQHRKGAWEVKQLGKLEGKKLAYGKFMISESGTKDNVWGSPLLENLYYYGWLKKHAWKYFANYIESFASPTPVGTYKKPEDPNGEKGKEIIQQRTSAVLTALKGLRAGNAIAIPENDFVLSYLEANRSSQISYEGFIQLIDRAQGLVMLGEVDTSGLSKGPGSFAKSRVSNEVRLETIRIDAHHLSTSVRDNLLAPLVRLNFPAGTLIPRFFIDVREAEDLELRRAGAQALYDMGLPVPKSHLYTVYQCPEPRENEEVWTKERESQGSSIPLSPPPVGDLAA